MHIAIEALPDDIISNIVSELSQILLPFLHVPVPPKRARGGLEALVACRAAAHMKCGAVLVEVAQLFTYV